MFGFIAEPVVRAAGAGLRWAASGQPPAGEQAGVREAGGGLLVSGLGPCLRRSRAGWDCACREGGSGGGFSHGVARGSVCSHGQGTALVLTPFPQSGLGSAWCIVMVHCSFENRGLWLISATGPDRPTRSPSEGPCAGGRPVFPKRRCECARGRQCWGHRLAQWRQRWCRELGSGC